MIQSKLVELVVAARKNTGDVGDERAAVNATPAVTHHDIVSRQRHLHRLTAALATTPTIYL